MMIPKKLEPPQGSEKLEQAHKQVLLAKVASVDKLKLKRKLLDTPEMRQTQLEESILEWRVDSLLPYAELCLAEAEQAIPPAKAKLEAFDKSVEQRMETLGVGLGKMLGNPVAGNDLCSLLSRMGGGYLDQAEKHNRQCLQDAVNRWGSLASTAKATISDIEALQGKPLDGKKAQQKNKQNLLANLNNNNTESEGE